MLTSVLKIEGIKKEDLYGGLLAWLQKTYTDVNLTYDAQYRLHSASCFNDTAHMLEPPKTTIDTSTLEQLKPKGEC